MRDRFLIAGIAAVLTLGGWASALAAVVCPHTGGGEAHACCRKDVGEGASCGARVGESGGVQQQELAASHGAAHASHESRIAIVEKEPRAQTVWTPDRRADFCAHCLSRTLPLPASSKAGAPENSKRAAEHEAPSAEIQTAPFVISFIHEVIPSQGAPPCAARLHVLNSVFLI